MRELIINKILEKVRTGELTDAEARAQYAELLVSITPEKRDAVSTNSCMDDSRCKDDAHLTSYEDRMTYDRRTIEVIKTVKNPTFRLFVFLPFGFGNEAVSWTWKDAFADNTEVWLIGACDISDWRQLVSYYVEKMVPLCDVSFAVFGHSSGGIIAYEVLVELEQKHELSPDCFIPSSVSPPRIFKRMKILSPFNEITDEMDMVECRTLLENNHIILPLNSGVKTLSDDAIRCDIELIKTYSDRCSEISLSCPILALQANNDILVKDSVTLSLWKDYTNDYFLFQEIEGTHLYFMNPPESFFQLITSASQNREWPTKDLFEDKIYRLTSFHTGTEDVYIFPYGTQPKGYLIYQADGKMATHLWDSSRNIAESNAEPDYFEKDSAAKMMLTYLSYSGDYKADQGAIDHSVCVSTNPNFINEDLIRYYRFSKQNLTLVTAPLTLKNNKQSQTNTFSKLVWEEIEEESKYAGHPLIGSWSLYTYKDNKEHVFGRHPKGVLLLTKGGYFSVNIVGENIVGGNSNLLQYDNLILASDDEINNIIRHSRSYCGRFEITDNKHIVYIIEENILGARQKNIRLRFELSEQQLELRWTRDTLQSEKKHGIIEQWIKNGKTKRRTPEQSNKPRSGITRRNYPPVN